MKFLSYWPFYILLATSANVDTYLSTHLVFRRASYILYTIVDPEGSRRQTQMNGRQDMNKINLVLIILIQKSPGKEKKEEAGNDDCLDGINIPEKIVNTEERFSDARTIPKYVR